MEVCPETFPVLAHVNDIHLGSSVTKGHERCTVRSWEMSASLASSSLDSRWTSYVGWNVSLGGWQNCPIETYSTQYTDNGIFGQWDQGAGARSFHLLRHRAFQWGQNGEYTNRNLGMCVFVCDGTCRRGMKVATNGAME